MLAKTGQVVTDVNLMAHGLTENGTILHGSLMIISGLIVHHSFMAKTCGVKAFKT